MKIDEQGITEIKNTIETPMKALAKHLSKNRKLDPAASEMISFIFDKIHSIGETGSNWETIK